ncbi:hypothetical protein MUB05_11710 [Acinetobacter indicus]|nr:hypothetical protein [Acinetobacter indicus]MCP0917242.1 hypothetical protein [Acinetobacter indicus]MCP0920355.1 hypothetical protein [Acinetobacter indicus]MCP0923022.1 hypothetical protein [Acinetobacter indicus]UNW10958.1 hypothetical protein MOW14_02605 [Acinetobacter indicus]
MCVNDFWKIILISSLLIQLGCSNRIYEQPSDKYPFGAKMKALLGDNLKIVNSLSKAELGAMAGAKIGLILSPVTGGASIAIGGIVGAGIGAVALGVGGGFAGSYGGTQVARKYTGVCD